MFTNESTENLLDNLENELTEVIALENPTKIVITAEIETEKMPPIPRTRNFASFEDLSEVASFPVPLARKLQSLEKKKKDDENEIIQLSSLSSSSASENHKNYSQHTVKANERRENSKIPELSESSKVLKVPNEETFFVVKQGKWAEDEKKSMEKEESDEESKVSAPAKIEVVSETPNKIEKTSKKTEKNPQRKASSTSCTASSKTSVDSSSEALSSSSEESLKVKKNSKKRLKDKKKKKSKKKSSSDEAATSTENSVKEDETKNDLNHAIGIFLHSTGTLKFEENFNGLRMKISLFNEDSGKQIEEPKFSKVGLFNDDFFNLTCTWNELLLIEQDFKRLKEIYNNVLIFFEVINVNEVIICWAFLKLFSPKFANIDDKFQLQFFEHQKINKKFFFSSFRKIKNSNEIGIFDQWRSTERKKFSGILNVTVKVFVQKQETEAVKEVGHEPTKDQTENINRRWQKLPGQACKIPNKVFSKINFHEKGSMNVKFSQDGNFLAFTEVIKDGSILHIVKFPEMQEIFTMMEHSDLIHDIDWLRQKQFSDRRQWMVSGSSDFTAIIWRLEESCYTYHILPHPAFVYCSKFLQSEDSSKIQVVTAGRDCVIRIWQSRKKLESFDMIQELKHPNANKSSYITAIATRNAETFYTSNSQGDVVEWTLKANKEYHLNRQFKLGEIAGKTISSLELHPRGNKIFLRVQDFTNGDLSGSIFVLGVPTGLITQKYQQPMVNTESQGRLKVTTCGTYIFSSNGSVIRFYSLQNGNLTSNNSKNFLSVKITSGDKITSMDYHPKDFYFACAIYGRNGGIVVCNFESETNEKDLFTKLKLDPTEIIQNSQLKATSTNFSEIIRKLDEVFLAPIDNSSKEIISKEAENTFTVDSKRSRSYSVSQGPATYTIQKNQNNTYEIPRKDESDDDTTISESLN